jgi:hypothetical protein
MKGRLSAGWSKVSTTLVEFGGEFDTVGMITGRGIVTRGKRPGEQQLVSRLKAEYKGKPHYAAPPVDRKN